MGDNEGNGFEEDAIRRKVKGRGNKGTVEYTSQLNAIMMSYTTTFKTVSHGGLKRVELMVCFA